MLIHPQIDPIAISLGPLAVRWYGLMYLIAFGLFFFLGRYRARRDPWRGATDILLDDLLFWGVMGVVLGGRLGYVLFYKPAYYLAHPLEKAEYQAFPSSHRSEQRTRSYLSSSSRSTCVARRPRQCA